MRAGSARDPSSAATRPASSATAAAIAASSGGAAPSKTAATICQRASASAGRRGDVPARGPGPGMSSPPLPCAERGGRARCRRRAPRRGRRPALLAGPTPAVRRLRARPPPRRSEPPRDRPLPAGVRRRARSVPAVGVGEVVPSGRAAVAPAAPEARAAATRSPALRALRPATPSRPIRPAAGCRPSRAKDRRDRSAGRRPRARAPHAATWPATPPSPRSCGRRRAAAGPRRPAGRAPRREARRVPPAPGLRPPGRRGCDPPATPPAARRRARGREVRPAARPRAARSGREAWNPERRPAAATAERARRPAPDRRCGRLPGPAPAPAGPARLPAPAARRPRRSPVLPALECGSPAPASPVAPRSRPAESVRVVGGAGAAAAAGAPRVGSRVSRGFGAAAIASMPCGLRAAGWAGSPVAVAATGAAVMLAGSSARPASAAAIASVPPRLRAVGSVRVAEAGAAGAGWRCSPGSTAPVGGGRRCRRRAGGGRSVVRPCGGGRRGRRSGGAVRRVPRLQWVGVVAPRPAVGRRSRAEAVRQAQRWRCLPYGRGRWRGAGRSSSAAAEAARRRALPGATAHGAEGVVAAGVVRWPGGRVVGPRGGGRRGRRSGGAVCRAPRLPWVGGVGAGVAREPGGRVVGPRGGGRRGRRSGGAVCRVPRLPWTAGIGAGVARAGRSGRRSAWRGPARQAQRWCCLPGPAAPVDGGRRCRCRARSGRSGRRPAVSTRAGRRSPTRRRQPAVGRQCGGHLGARRDPRLACAALADAGDRGGGAPRLRTRSCRDRLGRRGGAGRAGRLRLPWAGVGETGAPGRVGWRRGRSRRAVGEASRMLAARPGPWIDVGRDPAGGAIGRRWRAPARFPWGRPRARPGRGDPRGPGIRAGIAACLGLVASRGGRSPAGRRRGRRPAGAHGRIPAGRRGVPRCRSAATGPGRRPTRLRR